MVVLLLAEVRQLLRSPVFLIFTIGFPVAFFLIFAELYAGESDADAVLLQVMLSMAAYGGITAAVTTGGRVALERAAGWNRQLRLTPLSGWSYLVVKAAVAMVVALPAMGLVFAVGALRGVELSASGWAAVLLAVWIGVLPFAAIGLLIGTLATGDSAQGMMMVTMLLFSLLGGIFIPVQFLPPVLLTIAHALPSFWMVDIAARLVGGGGVPPEGVLVIAGWFLVAGALAVLRYRRDALRV